MYGKKTFRMEKGRVFGYEKVERIAPLWYAKVSSSTPLSIQDDESEETLEGVDEVLVSDAECPACGGPVNGTCRLHGDRETALRKHNKLFCNEWDFAQGRECRIVLVLKCHNCANEEETV